MATDIAAKRRPDDFTSTHGITQPAKRVRLLDNDDESGSDTEEVGLKINQEYARRFEHNKKRTELHRLEEKYGRNGKTNIAAESQDESSDHETEDEDGELANDLVDAQISATLDAIRSKDPRIYAEDVKFFSHFQPTTETSRPETDKPLYLRDYHRQNLLEDRGDTDQLEHAHLPYAFEQAALKKSIVDQINAAAEDGPETLSDEDAFLVKKHLPTSREAQVRESLPDPTTADENPDTYLSNFFASRAWRPTGPSQFQPLESDDDEEEAKADEFENAWNLRFEDPETSNKFLTTHSREVVAKYSVRRDPTSGRKKTREQEKQKKLAEKRERNEERKRFKNLKMLEMEEKLEKIREAAGLSGKHVQVDEWADMLEADWNDEKWDKEMRRRFGNDYYEAEDDLSDPSGHQSTSKPKKPKWDLDIDIKDIVPHFDGANPVQVSGLTDEADEADEASTAPETKTVTEPNPRRDRRIIEALAEQQLPFGLETSGGQASQPFRYRETSPNTFGLSALDILAADDSQLNQYVGLKKLAAFRDPERKKKDKSKLSKKARLRAWRKETFGREDGPAPGTIFAPEALQAALPEVEQEDLENVSVEKKKKKKRKRKSKASAAPT